METNTLDSNLINESEGSANLEITNAGRRFANFVIDTFVIYIIFFIFFFALALTGDYDPEGGLQYTIYLFMFAYHALMEGLTGKTIGKYITKTKVVTEDGEKPTMKTALIRTLCRFIPFEAFSFFGTPCQGWHDSLAKSKVVNDKK